MKRKWYNVAKKQTWNASRIVFLKKIIIIAFCELNIFVLPTEFWEMNVLKTK